MLQFKALALVLFVGYCTLAADAVDVAPTCDKQKADIQTKLTDAEIKAKFVTEYVFDKDNKPLLLITWAGKSTLLVVTIRTQGLVTRQSDVYRSTDDGKSFVKITNSVESAGQELLVMQANGLQRNPTDPRQVYLTCFDPSNLATSLIYFTTDSGATWTKSTPGFLVQSVFQFNANNPRAILAQSGSLAFVTTDAGVTWRRLLDRVFKVSWSVGRDTPNAVYAAVESTTDGFLSSLLRDRQRPRRTTGRQLVKTTDLVSWKTLADSIYSYNNKDDFLFISKADAGTKDLRHLEVSVDFGASFNRTQLPSATPDRFFAILDMSDGLAFVHMDAGNYQGHGTLYTSNSQGRVFSKSLERHMYPPLGSGTDFYKVESMRSTYLATVLHADKSMHSVVTHNRGASWQHLEEPKGTNCKEDPAKGTLCYLQVASQYSVSRGVQAMPPMSVASAAGLVVAHGHAAASLQSNVSDVYVSSDGGYSWHLALSGPHHVQIGNNGNFLVALPLNERSPRVVKFSTDAGRCWHSYSFTNESYIFTGLLTEPGNRALTVAIWGFEQNSHHWRVFILDLGQLLTTKCTDANYESWLTNGAVNYGSSTHRGCVLGAKETIKRLKPGSMCISEYTYTSSPTVEPCNCTKEDYECEYGYTREVNSAECVRDPDVQSVEFCDADTVKRIVTDGYRKLPGNRCQDGFKPNATTLEVLVNAKCPQSTEDPRALAGRLLIDELNRKRQEAEDYKTRRTVGFVAPLSITVAILLGVVLTLVVLARLRERRRRQLAFHYSTVSSEGRRSDLEYQPADGILNYGNGSKPKLMGYSATGATAAVAAPAASAGGSGGGGSGRRERVEDKQHLIEEDDQLIS